MKRIALLVILAALFLFSSNVFAENWPTWRGVDCMGISAEGNPPTKWSQTENIKWKVPVLGDGSDSTPVIWGDKLIYQAAVKTDKVAEATAEPTSQGAALNAGGVARPGGGPGGPGGPGGQGGARGGRAGRGGGGPTTIYEFRLVCLDKNTGKEIWNKVVTEEKPHQGHHADHGFASYSPVTDGKMIWANFGSQGMYCYNMDGEKVWEKPLVKMTTRFGAAGSLCVVDNAAIVVCDHEGDSFIFAFDKLTGDELWKKSRDETTTYTTPMPVKVDGKTQIIVVATNKTRSYDLLTGEMIWECGGQVGNVIPTPVVGDGVVYCTSGYRGSSLQAIKLGGTGDITGSDKVLWEVKKGTPYVPSPLLYKDRIYVFAVNTEKLSCYNAKTGEPLFEGQSVDGMKGVYASPVGVGDNIYFVGRDGGSAIIKASDTYEVVATNKLDDVIDCSPVIIGKTLYLKGAKTLYCIEDAD